MNDTLAFDAAARIPASGDNAAVAVRHLPAGTNLKIGSQRVALPLAVPEGHRFAVAPVRAGEPILSWGLPFGIAIEPMGPGEYLSNQRILEVLEERHVSFPIPERPNFKDHFALFQLTEDQFKPGLPLPLASSSEEFLGCWRGKSRGAGTRNHILVLGTSSRTSALARHIAAGFAEVPKQFPQIDSVVAVTHTEGGALSRPNNLDFVLRALAGFALHPNVAATIFLDEGSEPVNNALLERFMIENDYPLHELPHAFMSAASSFHETAQNARRAVESWIPLANSVCRFPLPIRHLKAALQCGGSDAFSGISGNPLAGWVAREIVRHGGSANLAETDELIGAESYILQNVRDWQAAQAFLDKISRFQERAGWHGLSAESNPSGGNLFRGLYNIALKSIGAARKKPSDVRLDYVIDYAQRMAAPGYYFMDSPGNDLESIAGQVAAGCNLILFTTGNGSVTNFPFVPTVKIMTNSPRFKLLERDMDINAGAFLDGVPLDALGRDTFEQVLAIASGRRSAGEKAGHSQVQLWRDWHQTGTSVVHSPASSPLPSGQPLPLSQARLDSACDLPLVRDIESARAASIGLIVPTSLCAGQVAAQIASVLNARRATDSSSPLAAASGFLALPHTEGCGVSGDEGQQILQRTLAGYLFHPLVTRALFLEHGCEKTHNDAMRQFLRTAGYDDSIPGWASIQADGGIEWVTGKVIDWFEKSLRACAVPAPVLPELAHPSLAFSAHGPVQPFLSAALARMALAWLRGGGTVVVPDNFPLLASPEFKQGLGLEEFPPTLPCAGRPRKSGLHVMQMPTNHPVEIFTALGAAGVSLIVHMEGDRPKQSHPLVPVLQIAAGPECSHAPEFDLVIALSTADAAAAELLNVVLPTLAGRCTPKQFAAGNVDHQVTRGHFTVST